MYCEIEDNSVQFQMLEYLILLCLIPKLHSIMSDSQIAFLQTRPMDLDSASLIACGTGGWIQMWNIYGGGLIGEFNIWDNLRHRLDKEDRQLQSITALKIDSNNDLMITGNSIGYIQVTCLLAMLCCLVQNYRYWIT